MYCDKHPDLQQERISKRINFTGENDPDKIACPSTAERPLNIINKWHGNRSTTQIDLDRQDIYYNSLADAMKSEPTIEQAFRKAEEQVEDYDNKNKVQKKRLIDI